MLDFEIIFPYKTLSYTMFDACMHNRFNDREQKKTFKNSFIVCGSFLIMGIIYLLLYANQIINIQQITYQVFKGRDE